MLTEEKSPKGYCLLKLIRTYIEIDIYLSLEVHTDDTLQEMEALLPIFQEQLLVCIIILINMVYLIIVSYY